MQPPLLYFNGLDAEKGTYALPAMSWEAFVAATRGQSLPRQRRAKAGVKPRDLESAGWGVVTTPGLAPEILEALEPLLDRRRAMVGDEKLFRVLTYRPGERALGFLSRHGAGLGPVDPRRVPYHLLLVAGPDQIPYSVQYDLTVQHSVGRLDFASAEEYACYAKAVVTAETGQPQRERRAVFFASSHPDDPLTRMSVDKMVEPLAGALDAVDNGWRVERVLDEAANKVALARFLGARAPALLFTAGHAVVFGEDNERQATDQGALVCDWPGPKQWKGPLHEDHYFAAHDLVASADLTGMITFHFACHSAGTPRRDSFQGVDKPARRLAEEGFVAALPRRLLAAGALAVIGHIDRAWVHSFLWEDSFRTAVFESALYELMDGAPVGLAMQYFGERHGELASHYATAEAARRAAAEKDSRLDDELARLWAAYHDARGYVILGDPAVRLAPTENGE